MQTDLRILLIEITQKCNARCDQCGSRCDINSEEKLSKKDILNALKDVKENIGTDVMINITGGEPMLRQDLCEIMSEVTEMGFDWGMVTNGTLLNDENIIKLKDAGLKTITVSLDGLRDTHDSLRHLPGSFDVIIENLKKLKKADFLDHLQVTFTSNKRNVYEFPKLYEILDQIGLDSIRTSCIDMIGRAQENEDLSLGLKELHFMTSFVNKVNATGRTPIVWGCPHYLNDQLNNRKFVCFAGIYSASILYNGDIFACPNIPRREKLIMGNILTDSFSKVWKESFEIYRNREIKEYCRDCKYVDDCRGDSLHSWDFDLDKPKFCYRDIFDKPERKYVELIKKHYPGATMEIVEGDKSAANVYIEPQPLEDIKRIFHFGKLHPSSMYEQQVALIGFKVGSAYIVKYVVQANAYLRYKDNAIFKSSILKEALYETNVINRNLESSEDASDYFGKKPLRLLGFAHSHPIQKELCYSIGDESIHKRMFKKLGDYVGILIYPKDELIGAYYGKDIKQANLILVSECNKGKDA